MERTVKRECGICHNEYVVSNSEEAQVFELHLMRHILYKLSDQIGDLQKIFGGKGYVPEKVERIIQMKKSIEPIVTPTPEGWRS